METISMRADDCRRGLISTPRNENELSIEERCVNNEYLNNLVKRPNCSKLQLQEDKVAPRHMEMESTEVDASDETLDSTERK